GPLPASRKELTRCLRVTTSTARLDGRRLNRAGASVADLPDTFPSPGAADPAGSERVGAETIEAEPSRIVRLQKLCTIFLGGLLALAVLAASYVAAAIVLPILLAFVLNLVFRPVLRVLLRARLPQPLAALIIVLSLGGVFCAVS